MKNRGILKLTVIICLVLVVVAMPFAISCSQGSEKTLKIGITTPSSGPAAEKGTPMGDANRDAIKYINDELGGVNGYPIELVWLDNGYDATSAVTNVKKFMDDGCLMFGTASSAMMTATMEIANRAGFPGLVCFNAPNLHRPPEHIYGQLPDYGDDFLAFAKYYLENIWKGPGKPKVVIEALNNSTGQGAIDAARAYGDQLGLDIVWDGAVGNAFEHTTTTISETEALTRIKALNPDVLYIASTPQPASVIIKNAIELGMYPGITIALGHAAMTKALIDLAGASAVEGVYGLFPAASWGDDVPGMAKLMEYAQKLHPKDVGNGDYITSWAQSLVMAEILKTALDNVGYDVLAKGDAESWEAIETQGIQKLSNYDAGGLQGPVSYTPGDNRLTKSLKIFQIQNGAIVPITDWIETPLVQYENFDWFGK